VTEQLKTEQLRCQDALKNMYNPHFGSVFRTAAGATYFFFNMCRYADVYTSSFDNFLNYPLHYCFYALVSSAGALVDVHTIICVLSALCARTSHDQYANLIYTHTRQRQHGYPHEPTTAWTLQRAAQQEQEQDQITDGNGDDAVV
jgi:hypothetical protein